MPLIIVKAETSTTAKLHANAPPRPADRVTARAKSRNEAVALANTPTKAI